MRNSSRLPRAFVATELLVMFLTCLATLVLEWPDAGPRAALSPSFIMVVLLCLAASKSLHLFVLKYGGLPPGDRQAVE